MAPNEMEISVPTGGVINGTNHQQVPPVGPKQGFSNVRTGGPQVYQSPKRDHGVPREGPL